MEKHKIDKLFSEKLTDFADSPTVNAWAGIEQGLDKGRNKRLWSWLSIAASAVLVLASSYYMLTKETMGISSNYTYSSTDPEGLDLPVKVVYVPVFIQVTSNPTTTIAKTSPKKAVSGANQINEPVKVHASGGATFAEATMLSHDISPIIKEPLPVETYTGEDMAIASTKDNSVTSSKTQTPLTIIYKQGAATNQTKFTQAISYMEEVRNGDKKLIDFKKLRESIQSKFNSEKETNSK